MPDPQYTGAGEFEQFEGSHEAVPQTTETDAAASQPQEGTQEEWRQAYDNKQSWERSLKQKDQRYGNVRRVLETAFGRGMDEWNAIDMTDLQAFAALNSRIRTDPDFAKKWHGALTQSFQEGGESKAEASKHASEVVGIQKETAAAAASKPEPKLEIPQEFQERMTRMEKIAVQQEMNALESTLWGELDAKVTELASDLKDDYGDLIEEQVLQNLYFHPDQELIKRAYDGTLPQLVGAYVKRASDRLRGKNTSSLQRRATARKAAPPVPFGAAAGATPGKNPNNMTMKEMSERFTRAMGASEE